MNPGQQDQLNKLYDLRDEIHINMIYIQSILKENFPEEYSTAYQHWIPQILTALDDHPKWLNRGVYTMQDTINKLKDKNDKGSGITKII